MPDKNFPFWLSGVTGLPDMRTFAIAYGTALRRLRGATDATSSAWVCPPLPVRFYDWQVFRNPEGPVGLGATEREALDDLLMQEATYGTAE